MEIGLVIVCTSAQTGDAVSFGICTVGCIQSIQLQNVLWSGKNGDR